MIGKIDVSVKTCLNYVFEIKEAEAVEQSKHADFSWVVPVDQGRI